jgi:hypothetical protein
MRKRVLISTEEESVQSALRKRVLTGTEEERANQQLERER